MFAFFPFAAEAYRCTEIEELAVQQCSDWCKIPSLLPVRSAQRVSCGTTCFEKRADYQAEADRYAEIYVTTHELRHGSLIAKRRAVESMRGPDNDWAVPELLVTIEMERDWVLRNNAALALVSIGTEDAELALLYSWKHLDPQIKSLIKSEAQKTGRLQKLLKMK